MENQGGGSPAVLGWSADVIWLTVAPAAVDSDGFGSYAVSVDRTGLSDGLQQGNVQVEMTEGNSIDIPVSILIDSQASAGSLVDLRVFLLESATTEIIARAQTEVISGTVFYQFPRVTPGSYYVVAGSDLDADKIICQIGELCGTYGSGQQAVQVNSENMTGLDFPAGILESSAPVAY